MGDLKIKEIENRIRSASPLDLAKCLQDVELYDQQATAEVIEEIYQEFSTQDNIVDKIVVPVFTSIADGFLESTAATRKLRKKGLTASKIVSECRSFSYDNTETFGIIPDGYTEWKNVGDKTKEDFKQYSETERPEYTNNRSIYEDTSRLNAYKESKFANNGGRINATDEYTGEKNVYQYRRNPDARRNIEKYKHDHQAEVDHIVPLAKIHEQLKGNYALTDEDIKTIANNDTNYALTSARINRGAGAPGKGGKFDMTTSEFVEDQRQREKEGRPNQGLSEDAKENMLRMGKEAQKNIDNDANKAILSNITGKGTGNTEVIWEQTSLNAVNQSKDYVIGNVILYMIKPLYYEISDIFINGLEQGVNAENTKEALKYRFLRIKDYVLNNAMKFLEQNVWEFLKSFISSLVEGIISLFIGIFKQILKIVKEGIKVFIQAGKVLFGKQANNLSPAQKGDAIIKLIGGTIISLCGIGLESLMNRIGITEPWSIVLSTMFAGLASALFMLLLDELDLFSVKSEKRRERIEDIFSERIKDIEAAANSMDTAAMEIMKDQRLMFSQLTKNLDEVSNIDDINTSLFSIAAFMGVDLSYYDRSSFVDQFDNMELSL